MNRCAQFKSAGPKALQGRFLPPGVTRYLVYKSSGLHAGLKIQGRKSELILVLGVHIADGGIGLLQLRLTQFND